MGGTASRRLVNASRCMVEIDVELRSEMVKSSIDVANVSSRDHVCHLATG